MGENDTIIIESEKALDTESNNMFNDKELAIEKLKTISTLSRMIPRLMAWLCIFLVVLIGYRMVDPGIRMAESAGNFVEDVFESVEHIGKSKIPCSPKEFKGMHVNEAEKRLKNAGFWDIKKHYEEDIYLGIFARENEVEYVTVYGTEDFNKGDWQYKTANIVIYYHVANEKKKLCQIAAITICIITAATIFAKIRKEKLTT